MAQKVSVLLLCDMHDDGVTEAQETLSFAVDGGAYEIDVCADHAAELRGKLAPFTEHARRIRGAVPAPRGPRRTTLDRARTAEIRAWAKERGHELSERGRIPASVVAEYEQNH